MRLIRFLEDQLLAMLQRRCHHPVEMVAADILEGCGGDLKIPYCRRCGAVKTDWAPAKGGAYALLEHTWRTPDPNLWRG